MGRSRGKMGEERGGTKGGWGDGKREEEGAKKKNEKKVTRTHNMKL